MNLKRILEKRKKKTDFIDQYRIFKCFLYEKEQMKLFIMVINHTVIEIIHFLYILYLKQIIISLSI